MVSRRRIPPRPDRCRHTTPLPTSTGMQSRLVGSCAIPGAVASAREDVALSATASNAGVSQFNVDINDTVERLANTLSDVWYHWVILLFSQSRYQLRRSDKMSPVRKVVTKFLARTKKNVGTMAPIYTRYGRIELRNLKLYICIVFSLSSFSLSF